MIHRFIPYHLHFSGRFVYKEMRPPESSEQTRTITLGTPIGVKNKIRTTKYTIIGFVPVFLFEQFRQFANAFFLVMAIIQFNPDTSPYGPQSSSVPLFVIILIAALKEIFEDYKRLKSDVQVNNQTLRTYDCIKGWHDSTWSKLRAGQIVHVTKGQSFAADLILLSSSEPAGIAYIETSNLDGETNLKIRRALNLTAGLINDDQIKNGIQNMSLTCEIPNKRLYCFQGSLEKKTASSRSSITTLDKSQFLQRGARLRNTDWVFALVVYAGKETKFMMNSVKTKHKLSRTSQLANYLMMSQFGILVMFTVAYAYKNRNEVCTQFINAIFGQEPAKNWSESFKDVCVQLIAFLVTFSSLVPISLYVTIQTIQMFQAILIRSDLEMYDGSTDIPSDVRSSMLTAELGEVSHVMADKTGTLTRNKMVFKNCSVGGAKYGTKRQEKFNPKVILSDLSSNKRGNAKELRRFLIACAVCHTVVPEKKDDNVMFHASSPDEHALVTMANDAGFKFHTRTPSTIHFTETYHNKPVERVFQVLEVIEFDSVCKRMGIIIRREDGELRLYVKGADSAVLSSLDDQQTNNVDRLKEHLQEFAKRGLRTLCFGYRQLDHAVYEEWSARYKTLMASPSTTARFDEMHRIENEMVQEITLIGASAIEDKLQDKVPETVAKILSAGIHLWMLTGDKLETAINIGFSCNLLSNRVLMLVLQTANVQEITDNLRNWLSQVSKTRQQKGLRSAVIVENTSLDIILADEDLTTDFLRLSLASHAVICCRCSPLQKASVTKLVKKYANGCVLAIGDGGNDIAMLQEAHIGVGIHGQEGNQAVMTADFSISQFKYLERLLFVHGTLSMFRTNRTILYTLYKNTLDFGVLAWFSASMGYTIQTYTDPIHLVAYNLWYTCFPALALGIFDRPAPIDTLSKSISYYGDEQNRFALKDYLEFLVIGGLHSFIIFQSNVLLYGKDGTPDSDGRESFIGGFGFCMLYTVVCVANMKALYESRTVNWPMIISLTFSVVTPILVMTEQSLVYPAVPWSKTISAGLLEIIPSFRFFFFIIFVLGFTIMIEIMLKGVCRSVMRPKNDVYKTTDGKRFMDPLIGVKAILRDNNQSNSLRTGYAFSQDDGTVLSQEEVMRAYDSRMPKQAGCDINQAVAQETEPIPIPNSEQLPLVFNDRTIDSDSPPPKRNVTLPDRTPIIHTDLHLSTALKSEGDQDSVSKSYVLSPP